ncbi:UNVERIFIED_CONTAM: hypothetical protein Sangu_2148200 [Sesamum angustifolium]|uniref:Uncharacterized protein n=1 Tax=Sesamum angustifolium TaxID=2727405 RepID=A0AAW2LE32_9LAMI
METPSNTANKQKSVETTNNSQALQVVIAMLPTSIGGDPLAPLALVPLLPRTVGTMADPPRRSTFSDNSKKELSPALKKKQKNAPLYLRLPQPQDRDPPNWPNRMSPYSGLQDRSHSKKPSKCPVPDYRSPQRRAIGCPLHQSCDSGRISNKLPHPWHC